MEGERINFRKTQGIWMHQRESISPTEKLVIEGKRCSSSLYRNQCSQGESVQFSSVAQLCPTLCDPMNHSTPGLPVHHQLLEFTQTHVHRVGDATHPTISSSVIPFSSCPQSFPALGSFQMSQLFA